MEDQEEREEPAERDYLIALQLVFDSVWGSFDSVQRLPISAASPEKAIEKLLDEVDSYAYGWSSLISEHEATSSWSSVQVKEDYGKHVLSGAHVARQGAECRSVQWGRITCEGEPVEVENEDQILSALNDALVDDSGSINIQTRHLSPDSACNLVHKAAYTNNGGGIGDEGHLHGDTDCQQCSDFDQVDVCAHGYVCAFDTARLLGWIDASDNVTDEWHEFDVAPIRKERAERESEQAKISAWRERARRSGQ